MLPLAADIGVADGAPLDRHLRPVPLRLPPWIDPLEAELRIPGAEYVAIGERMRVGPDRDAVA